MLEVLLCEKCGLVHPKDYDGTHCRQADCDGKLLPIRLVTDNNHETLTSHSDEPDNS